MAPRRSRDEDLDERALSRFAQVMRRRGRAVRVIQMPGCPGEKVALRCPTEGELTEADVAARKHLTEGLGLTALDLSLAQETELAKRERQLQLLALILRDPDDPEVAYAESADDLRDGLEEPQRIELIEAMEDFRAERFGRDTPEEGAKIVQMMRDLKAAGALSTHWESCDSDTQVRVVEVLLAAIPTPSSKPTGQTY